MVIFAVLSRAFSLDEIHADDCEVIFGEHVIGRVGPIAIGIRNGA